MSQQDAADAAPPIDVKSAIRNAKMILSDLLEGETYSQVGLEEIKYDDRFQRWLVTLGLNRPWNTEKQQSASSVSVLGPTTSTTRQLRTYKKLEIDGLTGELISMESVGD